MSNSSWDEIIERSTPEGAVSALILDMISLQKHIDKLKDFKIVGDYAAVQDKLNKLRIEFGEQFNPPMTS